MTKTPSHSEGRRGVEAGRRQRNQPAPPHAVYEALTEPHRETGRPWLELLDDEVEPTVLESTHPSLVVWSSPWVKRPDARIRFDLPLDAEVQGTDLCWTLTVDEPVPDESQLGHFRKRINELINRDMRLSFDC